ncbi:uncharacterized protein EV422DRAFT_550170 [Fimicolochytrium jonesii]|uniref:uncharacterized protein n=1 Tax=Fimicolochytrium jonesii TaxID=1396493 RepID=UPI0022FEB19A|nr:uncharacterized protein EV422DRAFT_550170 [Fimicolochytrium jonesii]KAI8823540.1 hypothetical protein EV422DRAFT_550170 [Fimicolochytrium jonesii]
MTEQMEKEGVASRFDHVWLRDNCQCAACIHPSNTQKLHSSADVNLALKPTAIDLLNNQRIKITWAAGSLRAPLSPSFKNEHTTEIDLDWLRRNDPATVDARQRKLLQPKLWDSQSYSSAKRDVEYKDFIGRDDGLRQALLQLRDFGLVFIRNAPVEEKEVERIAKRFGCIRETFYGTSWDVKSVPQAKNIAYTSLDLGLHMDLMYFEAPPGLQFLHSLKNSVKGGASIFLDSFKAAHILKQSNIDAYKALTEIPVTFHYINDGHHMHFRRPTIVEDDFNERMMVYYAPPFQGPLESDQAARFYPAFQAYADILKRPELMYRTLLRPGDCVVFANRRTLHGREEFDAASGERHLKGAYVDWDDFKDKLRVML